MLGHEEKRELLRIAREAIVNRLCNKPASAASTNLEALLKPRGAFVTLRIGGQLRGCIGHIESSQPLAHVVAEVAEKAAVDDPRFVPLTIREFEQTSIEISILSPLRQITNMEEIEVGVHGLLLEAASNRGLLLPQVAVEYKWNREQFLEATAKKAGLDERAWQNADAKLFVFSAEIVEEAEATHGGKKT